MAIMWFLAPYARTVGTHLPGRYCQLEDFTPQIVSDGGAWANEECLGNFSVAKVNASAATLQTINATAGFQRIPLARLDDSLGSLTNAQRNAVRNKVLSLGYTSAELQTALGADLSLVTLGQLLHFVLSRRFKPTYDAATDTINLNGDQEVPMAPEIIDGLVA